LLKTGIYPLNRNQYSTHFLDPNLLASYTVSKNSHLGKFNYPSTSSPLASPETTKTAPPKQSNQPANEVTQSISLQEVSFPNEKYFLFIL
jgi:hypothetical protein